MKTFEEADDYKLEEECIETSGSKKANFTISRIKRNKQRQKEVQEKKHAENLYLSKKQVNLVSAKEVGPRNSRWGKKSLMEESEEEINDYFQKFPPLRSSSPDKDDQRF
eukprot:TRINITY_DN1693_c0_g1_i3.p1 TRINITY_DN1693_c0_g1~~TRINITY_DN1693_c0_g1_i3.p1  ORF type:complete len:109 (+),score=24.58 TRINITY_DN1693_c0_g1_i3:424-750(+)